MTKHAAALHAFSRQVSREGKMKYVNHVTLFSNCVTLLIFNGRTFAR